MKKYISKICLFACLVIVLDALFGFAFDYLKSNAKGGSTHNNYYILNECNSDIIILGSSRAKHHYIPSVLEDSLNMTCYNCSEEGNGIMLANARFHAIVNRHKPKVVIYEITPAFDYQKVGDETRFLRYLKPYYNNESVKKVVDKFIKPTTQISLMSQMYQNNSSLLAYALDNISIRSSEKGYIPLSGIMTKVPKAGDKEDFEIDMVKLALLEEIANECKFEKIQLIFSISPIYTCSDDTEYQPATELAARIGIPVLNFLNLYGDNKMHLFQDNNHLNNDGALMYSNFFAHELKEKIKTYETNNIYTQLAE